MIQDVHAYIEKYVATDKPIPYKSFHIYPVLISDIHKFLESFDILITEKDKIPNADIIMMSYLEFIFNVLIMSDIVDKNKEKYGITYSEKLENIFSLCLHLDMEKVKIGNVDGRLILNIDDVEINGDDFDDIRRIIMYQNFEDYDDAPMDDDFKKAINDYYELKNRGINKPDFETKRDVVLSKTSFKPNEIDNLTYRRFERIFNMVIKSLDYIIDGIFTSQGANEGKLEHWIYRAKKEKYADAFVSAEQFKNKIQSV